MSLTHHTIFILGTTKFDNPYESASYIIAKNLASTNQVFYIENPYTWKDYFKQKGTEAFNRRKRYFSGSSDGVLATEIPNLKVVITPPLLSINFIPEGFIYRALLKINEKTIAGRITRILIKENVKKYIYINSFNFHYPDVTKYIAPELSAYHCVDPLILPFDKKHGLTSEPRLLKNSDVVICTSKQLYNEKKSVNPNTFFVPNAADISHSYKAMDSNLPVHESIAHLKKPIVGFFGHVERRMDFDLIKDITAKNPDKTFVFSGPISSEFVPDWFFHTSNIVTTGQMPYSELPAILKGFDVALIPFKKDEVSATIFPLKLFEYLGAGKPVIATNFNPDLEEFTKGTVRFCNESESFSRAISEELLTNSEEKIKLRLQTAAENTWLKRVEEFSEILEANLKTALKNDFKA